MKQTLFFIATLLAITNAIPLPAFMRGSAAADTNICGLKYSYCPRDPGCATYTMSVHDVAVYDANSTKAIKIEDVVIGSELTVTITGKTTMKTVPIEGSYRIYSLQGPNIGSGTLVQALTISGGSFTLTVHFAATVATFSTTDKKLFEFGVDVFQSKSGSNEGMCLEVASMPYIAAQAAKSSPPFDTLCKDNGDGHFTKLPAMVPMPTFPVVAPSCAPPPPPTCALDWYYCPRDPGCATYTMSVTNVTFHTGDASGYKAGDHVILHVVGTTTIKAIPVSGSYRIYTLSGKNGATGLLSDTFKLTGPGAFEATIPFTIPADSFDGEWFEFGLDVFLQKSGSDEGMCIEIANPAYVAHEKANPNHPFSTDCKDNGGGHFTKVAGGVAEVVSPVTCIAP